MPRHAPPFLVGGAADRSVSGKGRQIAAIRAEGRQNAAIRSEPRPQRLKNEKKQYLINKFIGQIIGCRDSRQKNPQRFGHKKAGC